MQDVLAQIKSGAQMVCESIEVKAPPLLL